MLTRTPHSTIRRSQRAHYDRATVEAILDEAPICHVGFVAEDRPVVIPTIHWRMGECLYFHGSRVSRLARSVAEGAELSISVALVDGLVLARSAFHHSMNYRSVVLFGRAEIVEDAETKRLALDALVEKLAPGRNALVRAPNPKELAATEVMGLVIDEGAAKIRSGPPVEDAEDLDWPVWAGVLPMSTTFGQAEPDQYVPAGMTTGMPSLSPRGRGPG